jgi:3'(2'), 5'-bisphosphate nucleotidase
VAEKLGITRPSVRMDSQCKYASIARGDSDIYLRLPTRAGYEEKIWDHAAGCLIVEEAGGTVTDITGRPLDFGAGRTLKHNRGVIATNGPWHTQVVEAVSATAPA